MTKVVILIITSPDDLYDNLKKIARIWDNSHPDVKSFFIECDPEITSVVCEDDTIYVPGFDGFGLPIIKKTIEAMRYVSENYDYDFIYRTNISSFLILDRFVNFVDKLPRSGIYNGVIGNHEGQLFVSGAGFLLSKDNVRLLISGKKELLTECLDYVDYDDVAIGKFFQLHNIHPTTSHRIDIIDFLKDISKLNNIPNDIYHFRIKNNNPGMRSNRDLFIHTELLRIFYNHIIHLSI